MAKNRLVRQPKGRIRRLSALHRGWLRLTRGRVGARFRGAPIVLLTTTGRKSGKERTWPLLALRDGDAYLLAASHGGHDAHPAWYLNLVEHPEVTIADRGEVIRGRARVATGDERARRYAAFVETYGVYAEYAEATDREIPVVVVEPGAS